MRRHVLADGLAQPELVDAPLFLHAAQVRHPHELDAALEGSEVPHLLEGGEVLLIGRSDQHRVEVQEEVVHAGDARLHRPEQVLVVLQGPLQQVGEFDHAAVPGDQGSERLVEREVLQRPRERAVALVRRHLPVVGVYRHLRLDGDRADHVPARNVEALHLHVPQHLEDVAVVRLQKRRVEVPALVAQLALEDAGGELEVGAGLGVLGEEPLPLSPGNEEQRVVPHLAGETRVDLLAFEMRVGLDRSGPELGLAEPDRALHQPLVGEDPVEAVERALVLARVVLERALQRGDERRFRRAVGTVEQDQLVHPAGAHERVEDAVDGVLDFFLSDHRRAALAFLHARGLVEGTIEQLEAAHAAGRPLDGLRPVVIEAIADVLRGVASVHARRLEECLHVFLEGEDRLVREERAADLFADGL